QSATNGSNITRPDLMPGMRSNPNSGTTAGCTFVNGIPGPYNSATATATNSVAPGQELGTPDLYYDPCAFKINDAGYYGTLGRDTVIGPTLRNFDFALIKNTAISENKSIQFRWEVFNLFNHSNFTLPANTIFASTTAASTSAGDITSAQDGRVMQFGLKVT